ncbi:MAG: sulfurtransferase TusA family protein [Alphaproteobacteria bacterium]|nr:sulfurtransferase TusA family protein [Alphaproteobacteria bacterium]
MTDGDSGGYLCDTRGLRCPMPVLMLRRFLKAVPDGCSVEVLADDPRAPSEFEAFCHVSGDVFIAQRRNKQGYSESIIHKKTKT